MNELAVKIGKRIKDERKRLGLTQSALAGEHMTRNMLSQIENGLAFPSVGTVIYLAEKLSVRPGYLLSEEESLLETKKRMFLPEIYRLFGEKDYEGVLHLFDLHFNGETDSETAYIIGFCTLARAERKIHSGNLDTAGEELRKAAAYFEKSALPSDAPKAVISLFSSIAENVQSPRLALDEINYRAQADDAIHLELFEYLSENSAYPYRNEFYRQHLRAHLALKKNEFQEALALLTSLEEQKSDSRMGAFLLFRIYADLETCYKELRDFEAAYRYSTRRIALLSAFHS